MLDYIWRGLVISTFTSSFILMMMLAILKVFRKKISQTQAKWYFNVQFFVLALVFLGNFVVISFIDPELANGCFAQFASSTHSVNFTRLLAGIWLFTASGLLCFNFKWCGLERSSKSR